MRAAIVLLTDFGVEAPYVGQMRGVLAERAPGYPILDLTHHVSPQDVREGAFLLEASWRFFPPGSVFVAVVDPGVGTERAAIALKAEDRFFVGPDNGLLTGALPEPSGEEWDAVRLENSRYRLPVVSATFHGRDLFAPAGAALATGVPLERLGPRAYSLLPLQNREPVAADAAITGVIVHRDRFGNLISNIRRDLWETVVERDWFGAFNLTAKEWRTDRIERTYADVSPGEVLALFGSFNTLELAVNGGSAANRLGMDRGETITLSRDL